MKLLSQRLLMIASLSLVNHFLTNRIIPAFAFAFIHQTNSRQPFYSTTSTLSMSSYTYTGETLLDSMSKACTESLGREVNLQPARGGGASGGGGASVSAAVDENTGEKYFIKSASVSVPGGGNMFQMLHAEYMGVKEMSETDTIKVPKPIAFGEHHAGGGAPRDIAFVVFEYLEFSGGGSGFELGQNLAKMHRSLSVSKQFGFHVDNTIGATPQPNLPWVNNWADYWDKHRLGHMLKLTGDAGFDKSKIEKLRKKTRELLSHNPEPSLIHGDLWGGNKGYAKVDGKVIPVLFDPATYYGDREADIAMTYVFGGFGPDFYEGYESEWPLPEGHEKRKMVYNLYHILNHEVLFGGMYLRQAQGMIDQILKM